MRQLVIDSGVVENVINAPEGFALEGKTVLPHETAHIGWLYDGETFTAPPAPDKYPDVQSARFAMVGYIDALTKQITNDYPASEVASWGSKAEAARAVDAGTARPDQTAMIQNEADITGRTLAAQATAIISKAEVFEAIIAKASGLRQATDIALVAATTSAEREAILQAAMTQAEQPAAPFGL